MRAWHHISQSSHQTIWAHFVAASGSGTSCRVSAGMNYFLKLLIKLSNCLNFATFVMRVVQKCWPHFIFVSISLRLKQFFPNHRWKFGYFLQVPWQWFLNSHFSIGQTVFSFRCSALIDRVIASLCRLANDFCTSKLHALLQHSLHKVQPSLQSASFCLTEVKTAFVLQQVYNVDWKMTDVEKGCVWNGLLKNI